MNPARRQNPHLALHRSSSTFVALAAFIALLGSAGAAGETPDAARVMPGEFDPVTAIDLIYAKLDAKGDAHTWTSPEYPDEAMQVSVLACCPFVRTAPSTCS